MVAKLPIHSQLYYFTAVSSQIVSKLAQIKKNVLLEQSEFSDFCDTFRTIHFQQLCRTIKICFMIIFIAKNFDSFFGDRKRSDTLTQQTAAKRRG